jgi:hypothetical protein
MIRRASPAVIVTETGALATPSRTFPPPALENPPPALENRFNDQKRCDRRRPLRYDGRPIHLAGVPENFAPPALEPIR